MIEKNEDFDKEEGKQQIRRWDDYLIQSQLDFGKILEVVVMCRQIYSI